MEMSEQEPIVEKAKTVVVNLLDKLGVEAKVVPHPEPLVIQEEASANTIVLNIIGDDLGILIGRHGQTLAALQYIVRVVIAQQTKSWAPIILDVEGYKQRRFQALRSLALRIADMVKIKKMPFNLEPMPAYERRIIHLALANNPDVITNSTGEGETRRVVISPKK